VDLTSFTTTSLDYNHF